MFDNPEKLFILFVIALMIFGPSKLASLGASLGRSIRDFRSAVKGAHDEFRTAVQEHVDTITPALPSPESMSLETPAAEIDYGTAMGTPATPEVETVSASSEESGDAGVAGSPAGRSDAEAAALSPAEDDPASLASEPTAAALRESLSH
ncbi:MAG TPA: twin-arginine translocase TatA/TatE family subunit [bacterium]|nr:twin-arginine translocase TatA/TatE family subunit [bacterium]